MDKLKEKCLKGEMPKVSLYDIHAHLGSTRDYPGFYSTTGEIIREMERIGIKKAIVFPLEVYGTEFSHSNDGIIDDCNKFPEHLIGFCMVNLNYPQKVIEEEIERCRKLGIVGIKLIAQYQGYPDEGKNVEFVCEYANHHKMPILNHCWGSPEFLEKLVRRYPSFHYICGHPLLEYTEVVNKYENVWFCTGGIFRLGEVEEMVRTMRNDRICWGSDFSDLHFGWTLGPILLAEIGEETKRMILGENMVQLLKKLGIGER